MSIFQSNEDTISKPTKFYPMYNLFYFMVYDKESFVALTNSFILGKGDGPDELISLTHTTIARAKTR